MLLVCIDVIDGDSVVVTGVCLSTLPAVRKNLRSSCKLRPRPGIKDELLADTRFQAAQHDNGCLRSKPHPKPRTRRGGLCGAAWSRLRLGAYEESGGVDGEGFMLTCMRNIEIHAVRVKQLVHSKPDCGNEMENMA
jgi:hypothetical protein